MGLFNYVRLSPDVAALVREQYHGDKDIPLNGWQSKSIGCAMEDDELAVDHIESDGRLIHNFTGEVVFYQSIGKNGKEPYEWLEFVAVYVDSKIVAVRHRADA